MRKSLFRKFFGIVMLIITVSFVVLGGCISIASGQYWLNEKRVISGENAVSMSERFTNYVGAPDVRESLENDANATATAIGAVVFVALPDGNVYVQSGGAQVRSPVNDELMRRALAGTTEEFGNFGGAFTGPYFTVGTPVFNRFGRTVGAVFVATSTAELNRFTHNILRMFTVSALMVMGLLFITVYFVTYRMVRPLRSMAHAARAMAQGDFTQRIPPDSGDEVGELAVAFNNMTKSLASLEQLRRSFIGNVSHELKTPITTIAGFIDGVLDGTIPEDEQERYLRIVSDEIKRLSKVVNSMLSLSRLESGEMKLSLTSVNIADILVRVTLTFEHKISEKSIEICGLEDFPAVKITADADLIYQVVYNLLDNAVKYTPDGGTIEFRMADSSDHVTVFVRNSGQGLSPQETARVFERFYKADRSRGLDKTSTGLGLYIVKTILEIHGGTASADSVLGQYTEFSFTLRK
ncbi:MAG: HAMP domain-containing histidine kinase [Oscillospiraceae bacterium]|jgi:signal transduction histidine kinase|nr:HAMP domain-containing histidine kinase [Oscillospiraceae bacterium]